MPGVTTPPRTRGPGGGGSADDRGAAGRLRSEGGASLARRPSSLAPGRVSTCPLRRSALTALAVVAGVPAVLVMFRRPGGGGGWPGSCCWPALGAVVDGPGPDGPRRASGARWPRPRSRAGRRAAGGGSAGAVDRRPGAGPARRRSATCGPGDWCSSWRSGRRRNGCGCWRRGSRPSCSGGSARLEAGERRWRWRHVGAVFEAHDLVGAGRPTRRSSERRTGSGTGSWPVATPSARPTGRWSPGSSSVTTAICPPGWRPTSGRPACRICSSSPGRT